MSFIKSKPEIDTSDSIWDIVDSLEITDASVSTETSTTIEMICENCEGEEFESDVSNGVIICIDCGVIHSELLDKNINSIDSKVISSYGCPTNFFLPNSSLGTKVRNGKFTTLSLLERWSQMPYKERSLLNVLNDIERKCKQANLTQNIIDNAKILFKRINDSKYENGKNVIIRGLNRKSLIASCVFHGAIIQNIPHTPKEIGKIFGISEKLVTKGCRKIREILNNDSILSTIKSSQTFDFITRREYVKKLKLSEKYLLIAKRMIENINKLEITMDHQPPSIAAGSILLLSEIFDLGITKKLISDTVNISQVTIMKTYKKIFKYKDIIIDNERTEKFLKLIKSS